MMILLNNQDITSLVDITSIVTNDTLDESLASGSMVIPFHTQKTPYARFSEVNIDGLLYVVAEDTVRLVRKGQALYRHEISLIEPTKILQKRVIPNLTITQPKGTFPEYVFSVNKIDETTEYKNTLELIPISQTSPSQDTNIVNGLTLKTTNPYEIFVEYRIYNQQFQSLVFPNLDGDANIEITAYYNDVLIPDSTRIFFLDGKTLLGSNTVIDGGYKIDFTPSVADGTITFKARTLGIYNTELNTQDGLWIENFTVKPSQLVGSEDNTIKLTQVIDKLLSFHPEFRLSESTRTRLGNKLSPEFTFQNYTLYDALKEVANYDTAIVYLGENDFNTIHFYYYDQVITDEIDYVDQEQVEYLDGFTDGFEINASNVIRDDDPLYAIHEPDQFGWLTVRANNEERGSQITDNQTAIHLQHPIYKPIQVLVRGLAFEMIDASSNVVNFANTEIWDITNYVVESQRYNTLESEEITNARGTENRKSNTVYYTQGQPYIQGLGFTGTVAPAWNTAQTPNFAIVEAILNTAQDLNPNLTFASDYLIAPDIHDLQFRVEHIPYSEVRLTVYKDNNRGKNIMYFNEQAPLNDMELLGRIAQENVNRSGNRVVRYEGLTNDDRLPLGSKQNDEILVNYTISRTPTINKFVAEYAVGYANISDYVGVDSAYRQYEVPVDTIVNRRDKLTQFFRMTASNEIPTVYVPDYLDTNNSILFDSLFANFKNNPSGSRPTYARIVIDDDKVVQSTIDAYRMGRTLGLAIDMQDNYSAGIKKVETRLPDGTIIKTQEDSRYTDDLGRFTQAEIEFYDLTVTSDLDESNNYPDNDKLGASKLFDYTYNVNKDARERYGFVWELVIQGNESTNDSVIIYDGFVKYNRLASELSPNTVEFRFLDKGYIPTRNLDITRTVLGTGSITVPTGAKYAQVQANATIDGLYEGLIVTLNQEPIFAILSDDYDTGLQVTKYLYPSSFADNDYTDRFTTSFTFDAIATGSATLSVEVTSGTSFEFNAEALGTLQYTEYGTALDSFTFSATPQYDAVLTVSDSVADSFEFNATPSYEAVLEASESVSDSFTFSATAVGDAIIIQSGSETDSFEFNATASATVIYSEFGQAIDSFEFNATATGQVEFAPTFQLRGYATGTPVNVIVDFADLPASSFTFQTFEQIIRNVPDDVSVEVTAPFSYTYNGFTYTFVDWRVMETGETSNQRVFTTTVDQAKTLRLRYIAFA